MATLVVKLGSSIVADDSGEVRADVLASVSEAVSARHEAGDDVVVVTSGAIARGMALMGLPMRPTGMEELQAASAVGQGKLYRTYDELLQARGVRSAQVLLTFFDMSARSHYLNARHTLQTLLRLARRTGDQRERHHHHGRDQLRRQRLPRGPGGDPAGRRPARPAHRHGRALQRRPAPRPGGAAGAGGGRGGELEGYEIGLSTSPLGSGGMRSKVVAAEMATAAGIPVTIASGVDPQEMSRALAGEPSGTRFQPQQGRVSSFKLWLRYAKPTHGRLLVDEGAERALRERGTSLLPVGVVGVEGEFEAGDAVEIRCDGRAVGKGIVNYSAGELQRIKGLKTEAVRGVMPRATEEAVHRDYFVLD